MEKKNIDWGNLGFGYMETEKRFVNISFTFPYAFFSLNSVYCDNILT